MFKLKRAVTVAAVTGSLTLLGAAWGALPASAQARPASTVAAAVTPYAPIHCGGDVCAQVTGISGSNAYIKCWANTASFFGHFELITPSGTVHNSPDEFWAAGGGGWEFSVANSSGYFTARAWEKIGTNDYLNIGSVKFQL